MIVSSKTVSGSALRAWLFLLRQDVKFTRLAIARLRRRNLNSSVRVVDPGGPVVSLTTFSARLPSVYLTLESIAAGSLRPSRLILWLQDQETFDRRPITIKRLEDRGLEVRLTTDYGPHSKYYPYLLSAAEFRAPLVTADDDTLYSHWWLAGLSKAHADNPHVVSCYRAHVVEVEEGKVSPYLTWKPCQTTEPSWRCFATGGAGVLYPAEFLSVLKGVGSSFRDLCPTADDIWLHANALRAGYRVQQISKFPITFPSIPGTQNHGLFKVNAGRGGNDEQIKKTYTPRDVALLGSPDTQPGSFVPQPATATK